MPFDAKGQWREPTEEDLQELKEFIEAPEDKVNRYSPLPKELVEELNSQRKSVALQKRSHKATLSSLKELIGSDVPPVDIILPVYGALSLVRSCVKSILERTWYPFKLTIIDDASDDTQMNKFYAKLKTNHPEVNIINNKKNIGFAGTVNRGILNTEGKYICVLNSDVIVTEGWLTKMLIALESDPKNQIVNPCTNNTALISVPMAPGMSYLDMNHVLETASNRTYPEIMPTGFCFMFRRELTDVVGMFDEGYGSYGEETDFWFKTISASKEGMYQGWRAVLADDTYLFHERGSSFSQLGDDEHMGIRKKGNDRFHALNPGFADWQRSFDAETAIGRVRDNLPVQALTTKKYKYNIAWVVNSTNFCGGMKYIADVVNQLIEEGVNAKVVCIPQDADQVQSVLPQLHTQPIFYTTEKEFIDEFSRDVFSEGIIVASVGQVVDTVNALVARYPKAFKSLHHIQSYDPAIAEYIDPDRIKEMEESIGLLDHTICSSKWVSSYERVPKDAVSIPPGVDFDTFHPRDRSSGDPRPTVMVYLNQDYAFRGYERGVALCKDLWEKSRRKKQEIRILAVGVLSVPECPYVVGLGKLNPRRFAYYLANEIDVFVDPSHVHSYGLPSLEALVSGTRVVSWMNGGVTDYAEDFDDMITVLDKDASPEEISFEVLKSLKYTTAPQIKLNSCHMRDESVQIFVKELNHLFEQDRIGAKVTVITPHLRKHGGPSTIVNLANILGHGGNDVQLVSIYQDFNRELINASQVPIYVDWDSDTRTGDVLIVNSDNPYSDYYAKHSGFKHKILLKLSHNARFKELEEKALNQDWDLIMTSSHWLRDACIYGCEAWNHKLWPEDKVKRIGWYHYNHDLFDCKGVGNRQYGDIKDNNLRIGVLIHPHPLKGSNDSMKIIENLRHIYGNSIGFFGIGDVKSKVPGYLQYLKSLNRKEMSNVMKQADIWINSSHTEGLGRMMLEAMSGGAAVVCSDTGADFVKDRENALVFPIGSIEKGTHAAIELIENKNLMDKVVKNGYETACKYSNPWEYVENLSKAIQGVLND